MNKNGDCDYCPETRNSGSLCQFQVLLLKNEIILLWLDELVDDSANDGVQQSLHRFSTPGWYDKAISSDRCFHVFLRNDNKNFGVKSEYCTLV